MLGSDTVQDAINREKMANQNNMMYNAASMMTSFVDTDYAAVADGTHDVPTSTTEEEMVRIDDDYAAMVREKTFLEQRERGIVGCRS